MDDETHEIPFGSDDEGSGLRARLGVWLGLSALIGLGAAAVWALSGPDLDGDEPDREAAEGTVAVDFAGAYDGLESIGLPVIVDPSVGLIDGQTVTVTASGFPAGTSVAVVQCWGLGRLRVGGELRRRQLRVVERRRTGSDDDGVRGASIHQHRRRPERLRG